MDGGICTKVILFLFSIISFFGGAALLGLGILIRIYSGSPLNVFNALITPNNSSASEYVDNNSILDTVNTVNIAAYILIGVGCFLLFIGLIGCCVVCRGSAPLLTFYAVCVLLVVVAEIATGITVAVYQNQVTDSVTRELQNVIDHYDYVPTELQDNNIIINGIVNVTNAPATATWNAVQVWIGCCGVYNYTVDFANTPYGNATSKDSATFPPPVFCCKFTKPDSLGLADQRCSDESHREDANISNFNQGCVSKVSSMLSDHSPTIIGITVGIGLIQLLAICAICCSCCSGTESFKYVRKVTPYMNSAGERKVRPFYKKVRAR